MPLPLSLTRVPGLPRLAWVAEINERDESVQASVGSRVEAGSNFIVEGAWNGNFGEADFHLTADFFGTGLVVDHESAILVPSRALVDRVLLARDGERAIASNSLPLLLAAVGARLDPTCDYKPSSFTSVKGIDAYDSVIPVSHPEIPHIQQFYFDPIRLTRDGVERLPRPKTQPIRSYEGYLTRIRATLEGLATNARDPARSFPMRLASTVSRGYDSAAVTALVSELDLHRVFTARASNSSIPSWLSERSAIDDGTDIALRLGISEERIRYLADDLTPSEEEELAFLAPTAADPETIFLDMAREISSSTSPALVFTGFHGDKVWERNVDEKYLTEEIRRGDTSGLNLSEIRLIAGFINAPVPFIEARNIRQLHAISNAEDMRAWSIGGSYDRPIPRRILEEKNVQRAQFGQRKKAVVQYYPFPKNRSLRDRFFGWLKREHGWGALRLRLAVWMDRLLFFVKASWERIARVWRGDGDTVRTQTLTRELDVLYQLHFWALEELVELRRRQMKGEEDPGVGSDAPTDQQRTVTDPGS